MDAFTTAYIEALYFTDTGEGGQPAADAELAPEALAAFAADCASFQQSYGPALAAACDRPGYDMARAGHDFWLTRNHHGAGFWDRTELDEGALGALLTAFAHTFPAADAYEGDDGLIHL